MGQNVANNNAELIKQNERCFDSFDQNYFWKYNYSLCLTIGVQFEFCTVIDFNDKISWSDYRWLKCNK